VETGGTYEKINSKKPLKNTRDCVTGSQRKWVGEGGREFASFVHTLQLWENCMGSTPFAKNYQLRNLNLGFELLSQKRTAFCGIILHSASLLVCCLLVGHKKIKPVLYEGAKYTRRCFEIVLKPEVLHSP